jgi:hypothetical protein
MTPIEAFGAVRDALAARNLPGSLGLVHATRTFVLILPAAEPGAALEAAQLLGAMGCQTSVSNGGAYVTVSGRVNGKLLPAPEPVIRVRSADSAAAAEAGVRAKRCTGCGDVKDPGQFPWWNRAKGRRGSACYECDRARQRSSYAKRKAAAVP